MGVKPFVLSEGTHVAIPWFEWPIIFDVRTRPRAIKSTTGTRDLQMVDIGLRVLTRPEIGALAEIYRKLGMDYDDKVLPSIVNEVVKQVIAQFNATALLTQREQVSKTIKTLLEERARDFHIVLEVRAWGGMGEAGRGTLPPVACARVPGPAGCWLPPRAATLTVRPAPPRPAPPAPQDVSITDLKFSREFERAVEAKQVAQQDAERARFVVEKALQDKRSTIIRAQGEAKSAELIGKAISNNPGFIQLRRIDAAKDIAHTISNSANQVYLPSDSLLLSLSDVLKGTDPSYAGAPLTKK